MGFPKNADEDLIDMAEWALRRVVGRLKAKPLKGQKLERMKLLEASLTNIELARFA